MSGFAYSHNLQSLTFCVNILQRANTIFKHIGTVTFS